MNRENECQENPPNPNPSLVTNLFLRPTTEKPTNWQRTIYKQALIL